MSASRDKKLRRDNRESGIDKKLAAKLEAEKKAKKVRNYTIAVVAVLVVFIAIGIVFNSSFLNTNFTAVTIDDGESVREYTAVDYSYYYQIVYYTYYTNYYPSYGEQWTYFLPEDDALEQEAVSLMNKTVAAHDAGVAAGFELDQEGLDAIETNISSIQEGAENNNFRNVDSYLAVIYCKGMTMERYRELHTYYTYAVMYEESIFNGFEYSDDEVEKYYAENADEFDRITYRSFYFDGAEVLPDEEAGIEGVSADAAMSNAYAKAEAFAEGVSDEKSFAKMAREYADESEAEQYAEDDATLMTGTKLDINYYCEEWLLNSEREEGDIGIVESSNGYYVLYFINRDDNNVALPTVRHILVADEQTANDVYEQWKNGDATEDSFAALAGEYSTDPGSEGGLYEDVLPGKMVPEFEQWCYDSVRKEGDTGIIQSDYGYHIMYYCGAGETYRYYQAERAMRDADYTAWEESVIEGYIITTNWFISRV